MHKLVLLAVLGAIGTLARYGLVVVLAWFGLLKFMAYEAEGIEPLVSASPLMGWLYERTRSLLPGILLHASYNTAVMFGSGADNTPSPIYWLMVLVLGAVGAFMLRSLLLPRRA